MILNRRFGELPSSLQQNRPAGFRNPPRSESCATEWTCSCRERWPTVMRREQDWLVSAWRWSLAHSQNQTQLSGCCAQAFRECLARVFLAYRLATCGSAPVCSLSYIPAQDRVVAGPVRFRLPRLPITIPSSTASSAPSVTTREDGFFLRTFLRDARSAANVLPRADFLPTRKPLNGNGSGGPTRKS